MTTVKYRENIIKIFLNSIRIWSTYWQIARMLSKYGSNIIKYHKLSKDCTYGLCYLFCYWFHPLSGAGPSRARTAKTAHEDKF